MQDDRWKMVLARGAVMTDDKWKMEYGRWRMEKTEPEVAAATSGSAFIIGAVGDR
jgi:hypothetical protein